MIKIGFRWLEPSEAFFIRAVSLAISGKMRYDNKVGYMQKIFFLEYSEELSPAVPLSLQLHKIFQEYWA